MAQSVATYSILRLLEDNSPLVCVDDTAVGAISFGSGRRYSVLFE
jgi:hypothetical protein